MKDRKKIFNESRVDRMCETLNILIIFVFFIFFIVDMSGATQSKPQHFDNSLSAASSADAALVCRSMTTRGQRAACARAPDAAVIALQGQRAAIAECQHQLRWHRWNCSELEARSSNPHSSAMLKRGFRETAFVYALLSAGVAHAVARGCAQGRLLSCGCDPVGYRTVTNDLENELKPNVISTQLDRKNRNPRLINSRHPRNINAGLEYENEFDDNSRQIKNFVVPDLVDKNGHKDSDASSKAARRRAAARWKWGGCSHNLDYGLQFSKMYLDSREKAGDIQSRVNLHNNQAGRLALASNMKVRCKCHGMSGSCQLKTCWRAAPELRVVASVLKEKFRSGVMVDPVGLNRGYPALRGRRRGQRKGKAKRASPQSLLYYESSPDFCERDATLDIFGTSGRLCRAGRQQARGSCASLCCGRGHDLVRRRRDTTCNCSFRWCCHVTCQRCTTEHWLTVCK